MGRTRGDPSLKKTPQQVFAGITDDPVSDEDYGKLQTKLKQLGAKLFKPITDPQSVLITPDMLPTLEANNRRKPASGVKKQRFM